MHTFLYITDILLSSITDFFLNFFNGLSSFLVGVNVLLCLALLVSFVDKGCKGKFFIQNKKIIFAFLILEIFSSIIATDINIVKINIIVVVLSSIVVLYKIAENKKVKSPRVSRRKANDQQSI